MTGAHAAHPLLDQGRDAAAEMGATLVVEFVLIRLANRLKRGRTKPRRRLLRRAAGAVVSEMVAEGVASVYAQRLRARAVIDRRAAVEEINRSALRAAGPRHSSRESSLTRMG